MERSDFTADLCWASEFIQNYRIYQNSQDDLWRFRTDGSRCNGIINCSLLIGAKRLLPRILAIISIEKGRRAKFDLSIEMLFQRHLSRLHYRETTSPYPQ